jgi:hypothetical protein
MDVNDVYPEINKLQMADTSISLSIEMQTGQELESASPTLTALKKYVVGSAEDNAGKVTTGQATAVNQYIVETWLMYIWYMSKQAIGSGESSTSDPTSICNISMPSGAELDFLLCISCFVCLDLLHERRMEFAH